MRNKSIALALCLMALAGAAFGQQRFLAIATGGTAGTYFPLGGALAEIWNKNIKNLNATAQATGASAANIAMLKTGEVDVIFVQNDAAYYAMNDMEPYKGKSLPDIKGLASLYDETCQLVALADSGIKTVADLKGKRVSVGAAGSGVELNARQILEAAGLGYADIKVQYLSFAESASNLKDGNIDAAFNTAGAPTAAIQDLSASKKIVLVPIDGAVASALMKKWAFYTPTKIPGKTYIGVDSDVMTVSVKSMLACSAKLDAALVYDLLKAMYANGERLAASHKKGADIKIATATDGMSIPLHPGAEKFFKESKK
jgi:uncharacterized protein